MTSCNYGGRPRDLNVVWWDAARSLAGSANERRTNDVLRGSEPRKASCVPIFAIKLMKLS